MTIDIGRLTTSATSDFATSWPGGKLQIASRARTQHVEGSLHSSANHLVMVTLQGGARRHRYSTDDGLVFDGSDRRGVVSILPAGCRRDLVLTDVEWRWAAFSIAASGDDPSGLRAMHFDDESFMFQAFRALSDLVSSDGGVDPALAGSMADATWRYASSRYFADRLRPGPSLLPAWRLRRVRDYIDANLGDRIWVGDLAAICGLSERQFYRAFHQTVGQTPIAAINAARVQRAKTYLQDRDRSIIEVARLVGFDSPTYFARVFQRLTGQTPALWRTENT